MVLMLAAGLAAAAYSLLSPKDRAYRLRTYEVAEATPGTLRRTTQATGVVTIPTQMEVRSPEAGYAKALYVSVGDRVEAGEIVAVLDVPDLAEQLSDLKADYETDLLTNEKAGIEDDISVAKSERAIVRIETDIADARETVQKLTRLVEVDSSSRGELEAAEKKLAELITQHQEAEADLLDERRIIEIDAEIRNASLDRTRTEIRRLEERIASIRIAAPMSGEIVEIASAISVRGTEIAANQSLLIIVDPDSAVADLELLEQYSSDVRVGDSVELTISNVEMTGTVRQIGRVAQISSSGLGATVAVRVEPVDPPIELIVGATAVGVFVLGVTENVVLLPRGPYLTTGNERYVYVVEDGLARRREVAFGQSEGSMVEVLDGIEPGERIITGGYQNFIEYPTVRLERGE